MPTAKTVSLADLAKSIDKAVALAVQRHAIKVEPSTVLNKWEIVGRVVRGSDLNAAFEFAKDVSSRINIPGLRIAPVTVKLGKQILVGFIDRGQLPRELPR